MDKAFVASYDQNGEFYTEYTVILGVGATPELAQRLCKEDIAKCGYAPNDDETWVQEGTLYELKVFKTSDTGEHLARNYFVLEKEVIQQ